jgi:hypothetical protein
MFIMLILEYWSNFIEIYHRSFWFCVRLTILCAIDIPWFLRPTHILVGDDKRSKFQGILGRTHIIDTNGTIATTAVRYPRLARTTFPLNMAASTKVLSSSITTLRNAATPLSPTNTWHPANISRTNLMPRASPWTSWILPDKPRTVTRKVLSSNRQSSSHKRSGHHPR